MLNAENARVVLDELLLTLAHQGCDKETTFGVHLVVEDMLIGSITRHESGG